MPGPYFQKAGWPPFVHQGTTYGLEHLSECELTVVDTDKQSRAIAVTFADHCFTREREPDDDPALIYGIVFSLDAVSGLPVQLHMRVQTAYPVDEKELVTFGQVRFRHLVALRMKGKRPPRVFDRNRK